MVIATLDTGSFDFLALGETREHALRTMRRAWNAHRRQTGATMTWEEVREDVNVHGIAVGTALRDGSILTVGVPAKPGRNDAEPVR